MSSFDLELEKELEKRRKKNTVTPQSSSTKSFDEQLDEELEHLKKYGTNTGKDTGIYSDYSVSTTDRTHGGASGKFGSATEEKKEEEEKKWFEKSDLFEDGWDFGDLTKTILGSRTDLYKNIGAGLAGIGEKIVDAAAFVAPYITQGMMTQSGAYYNTEYARLADAYVAQGKQSAEEIIKKDLYDEKKVASAIIDNSTFGLINKGLGVDSETDSVFGTKSDELAQSAGQLVGQMGVNAVLPGSGMALMGVTAFGSEVENALNQGATMEEAGLSAAISAGAEILTEKLGGISFGGKTLTDAAFSKLSRHMTSKIANVLITAGKVTVDALAEGGEEILSGYMSAIGQKLTYMEEKEISELFSSEDALDAFIGGFFLGGSGGGLDAVQSSAKGIDSVSGLNKNDKKVVDKVYKDLVAEEEQNGKISQKRKSEIYDEVLEQMERGGISTETIEEVLGGENYTAYQDTIKQENDALAELAELYEGDELKQRAQEFMNNSKRSEMAKTLSDSVYDMVKDSRLGESYRDRARRGQKFEADVTQYDEKQRVTIQRAIDSGVLNNTNRTHDMVDFIAKVSADTGVLFDFTNNEKLKDSIFAVNGKTVDGYITKDGITINVNSPRYINSVVGHEITHALEGTDLYETLETTLFEYAKEKGNYKDVLKDAYEMYRGEEGYQGYEGLKKIKKEAVANLVGDYLFTDQNFVNHLSANHQNIFQKVWNEVKYMVKIARAGSNEAKKLLEVQKAFEDAYRAGGKTPSDTKHSLSETTDGRFAAVVDNDVLANIDTSSWDDNKKDEAKKAAVDALKQFSDGIVVNGITTKVNRDSRREYTRSKDTERLYRKSPDVFADKMRAAEIADDIVVAATNWNRDGGLKHPRQDNFVDFDHGKTLIVSGNSKYIAEVVVGITDTGDAVFYDVVDMTPTTFDIKKEESPSTATTQNAIGDILGDSSEENLAQKEDSVKAKFSLSSAVEETKDLVALHNLTEDKLMKSLELGGLPMPSLAITKADIPHSNFGEITLVFGRDTIDPKKNKKNKIYSADAWTPVFPRTEYEADSKVANRVSQKLRELGSKIDDHFQRDLNRVSHGFESYLNSDGGEEGLIQRVMDNYGMKAAYLEDQGKHIDKVTKQEEAPKDYNPANADKYQKIMDILGVTTAEEIGKVNLKDARDNHGAELEAVYPGMTKTAMRLGRLLGVVESYIKNKDMGPVYNTVTDSQATQKAVDDALDAEGYEAWVRNLFSGIVKDSGIYNNKEIFTPGGNRRSFKQTHMPVTLENIVKAMASQNDGNAKNVSGFNGVKTLRAATAETFKSVEEMHQKKGRLQNLTQEQFEALTNDLQTRLYNVMEAIDNESGQIGGSNPFIRLDSIGEVLTEIGESGKYGVADIQSVFNEYSRNVSDDTALEVKQLLYDVAQMPVNIFEAKPQRVVNFDEAKVFVIPNNANTKLKQELLNRGYSIAEYDPNVDGDRQKVVNQFKEYQFSLSDANTEPAKHGNWHISGKDVAYEDIAPVAPTVAETTTVPEAVAKNATTEELFPDDLDSIHEELANLHSNQFELRGALEAAVSMGDTNTMSMLAQEYEDVTARIRELEAQEAERFDSIDDADAPPEMETAHDEFADTTPLNKKTVTDLSKKVKNLLGVKNNRTGEVVSLIENYSRSENPSSEQLFEELKEKFGKYTEKTVDETTKEVKALLRSYRINVSDSIKSEIADYADLMRRNFGRVRFSKEGLAVDEVYEDLASGYPGFFPESIINPTDKLMRIIDVANMEAETVSNVELDDETLADAARTIARTVRAYQQSQMQALSAKEASESFDSLMKSADEFAPAAEDDIAPVVKQKEKTAKIEKPAEIAPEAHIKTVKERLTAKMQGLETELANNRRLREESWTDYDSEIARAQAEYNAKSNKNTVAANDLLRRIERLNRMKHNTDADYAKRISDLEARTAKVAEEVRTGQSTSEQGAMRQELHNRILSNIRSRFEENGFDFDNVLRNAKNLSTFATVDNTPQRVMEKALGYKQGQVLSDLTVNQVAQNETEGIKWLNIFTDRKNGVLAQMSKQYHIKPGSKESAAAQMYAEGFYVNGKNEIVQYGDAELTQDFPDAKVRENIKGLARDPRIRQIYDGTLAKINESRARNAYPEIQRLDNYFLHFRAMDDTFSKLGIPFNPNDIKAKDLPTDLNGVTADLKPGQPYFASAMHRTGKRTSFDLLGGLERYLSSAKNQIYHIDDIQTLRALRNYVADTYGQAHGLESLDLLTEEEAQERIEKVYGSHLSTFAKFLNEEANVIAGKTALIDRGLEGVIGRRGITFLDTVNRQVGSNMVGFNVSSSLTNFLAPVQAFAKTNKFDFVKAFAQTTANKVGSIFGRTDGFAENSPVVIRRKGEDRFYRTPWQKAGDAGYMLMGAVDDFSTELIARAKYNELTRKGMNVQQAHIEADKWTSRLMGDRSLGQQPQLYNSKMLGMITKFQLEVRNQLDAQFYDTIQETKASNEDIQNGLLRNAKTAAKVTSTFVQLAVAQHLFGKAFESIAGYNPAFDIISAIVKAMGWDDDEDDEDTVLDNIEEGFLELLGDLPYTSTLTGGRIPISSALPVQQIVTGKDQYGNEKSRWETLAEAAPYYVLPGGYGQAKKTYQGLDMFSDEHPVAGSYTNSGNLRFPVEDTFGNRLQAGLFGQYASENARDYFDNERSPLKPNQIQEYIDSDLPIRDYWDYREGLSKHPTLDAKGDYIGDLDLPISTKNLFINNIAQREEPIDMTDYSKYPNFHEFDWAEQNEEKYAFLQDHGMSYADYEKLDEDSKKAYTWAYNNPERYAFIKEQGLSATEYYSLDDDTKDAYGWAYDNPEMYTVSKAVSSDFLTYYQYKTDLSKLNAKNEKGESVSGLKKERVIDYINGLDIDYGQKIILFRSMYDSKADKADYNADIVDYLNSRDDLSYEEVVTILKKLDFTVHSDGTVTW